MSAQSRTVTCGRFEQGLSIAEFLAKAAVNRDKFERNYNRLALTAEDLSFFQKAAELPEGPRKLLAIAEPWCGDVYRELPTALRIAEAGGMDLRIFPRDENPDIMDGFLSNGGKSRAIPVFVFYTADMRYIAHFKERPASAQAGLAAAMEQARAKLNLPDSTLLEDLPELKRQILLRELISIIKPYSDQWRRDTVKEIRRLLSEGLGLLPDR